MNTLPPSLPLLLLPLPLLRRVQCILGLDVPRDISHTHYSSLTVKNAIVDQFRAAKGARPSVDPEVRGGGGGGEGRGGVLVVLIFSDEGRGVRHCNTAHLQRR